MIPSADRRIICNCGATHSEVGECRRPRYVVKQLSFLDWEFEVAPDETWLRVRFKDAASQSWNGRKWRLSRHMLKSEIVQTALMAVLAAVEHEAREQFLYKGQAIFGPHYDVDRLVELVHQGGTAERAGRLPNE